MSYIRKTRDVWDVQQYTGPEYGWEDVCTEPSWLQARDRVREYRENQPEYPVRAKHRRERIEEEVAR